MTLRKELDLEIRKLPLLPNAESRIPAAIEKILIKPALFKNNELAKAKPCTIEKSNEELEELTKLCIKLHNHIDKLHRTSLERFEVNSSPHPALLQSDLEQIITISGDENFKSKNYLQNDTKQGRPEKVEAKVLTETLAKVYFNLTGKEPKRRNTHEAHKSIQFEHGEFLEFVEAIQKILEIKFSAKSQIKELKKDIKS